MNTEEGRLLLDELRQMRKLLELMAEPAVAQRDAKLRAALREIVGSSAKKRQSVLLMDGSRTQGQIIAQSSINQGDMSRLVGTLDGARLLADGKKLPKLAITIPPNFFDSNEK